MAPLWFLISHNQHNKLSCISTLSIGPWVWFRASSLSGRFLKITQERGTYNGRGYNLLSLHVTEHGIGHPTQPAPILSCSFSAVKHSYSRKKNCSAQKESDPNLPYWRHLVGLFWIQIIKMPLFTGRAQADEELFLNNARIQEILLLSLKKSAVHTYGLHTWILLFHFQGRCSSSFVHSLPVCPTSRQSCSSHHCHDTILNKTKGMAGRSIEERWSTCHCRDSWALFDVLCWLLVVYGGLDPL